MECLKYYAAACQTDQPNPLHRSEMKRNTAHILQMIDQTVVGYAPFLPVKLVVFPEFAHAAPVYLTTKELREKLAVPIPNEHTERIHARAQEYFERSRECHRNPFGAANRLGQEKSRLLGN